MSMKEYLYIDRARLDSYFEQISSPVMYEKVPSWEIGLELTGPKVKGAQGRSGRPFTDHEKIEALEKALSKSSQLHRPQNELERVRSQESFRIETVMARKVVLAARPESFYGAHGVTLWIANPRPHDAPPTTKTCSLLLLEGFHRGDSDNNLDVSVFSTLEALLMDLTDGESRSPLSVEFAGSHKESQSFGRDPSQFLQDRGARCFRERQITCLYRERFSASEDDLLEDYSKDELPVPIVDHFVVFGYAIYIMAADSKQ